MDLKRFKMIDEDFTCVVCGFKVKALGYSARDHCPNCLCSLHVDNNPGDRENKCLGILKPIDVEKNKKDTFKIVYRCQKCGEIKKNKAARDDNYEVLLEVMKNKNIL